MLRNLLKLTTAIIVLTSTPILAQTETESTDSYDDIDWSLYDDLGFEDESIKRYANAKIEGLSPAKLISFGYDFQSPYTITPGDLTLGDGTIIAGGEALQVNSTAGIRADFNLPVVSQTNLVWQMGAIIGTLPTIMLKRHPLQIIHCTRRFLRMGFAHQELIRQFISHWMKSNLSFSKGPQI